MAGINTLELVDGQQRITSLTILLKVVQERFKHLKESDIVKEIESYLICKGIDRKLRTKVLLGDLDNPDYIKLMKNEERDLIKNQNLIYAYDYFSDRLSDYSNDKLNEFYFKLLNNVKVIRLDIDQAKDAYKLFETINNRGLRLSPTDIIKNFLLGHASTFSEETLQKVRDNWKHIIINLDGIDTDDFFRQYMSSILKRKVTKSKLIDQFKRHYLNKVEDADKLPEYQLYSDIEIENDDDEIKSELSDSNDNLQVDFEQDQNGNSKLKKISITIFSQLLKEASIIYSKMLNRKFINGKINQHLFNLQRIKSFPSYILLLDIFQRKLKENIIIGLLKQIEVFMLRRHICEYRTGELDDIFSNLVKISNENITEEIRKQLSKHLPSDYDFEGKFLLHSYKGNANRAKYVLEMLEYDLIDDKGEYVLNTGNEVHLEHVIPQTINTKKSKRDYGNWEKYLGAGSLDMHKDYIHRIGNLTLLGQKLNIVASNNPYKAKCKEYKKSNIKITLSIADQFHEFRFTEIEKRSKDLAKIAHNIWQLQ